MRQSIKFTFEDIFSTKIKLADPSESSKTYLLSLVKTYGAYSEVTLSALKAFSSNFSDFATGLFQNIALAPHSYL